MLFKVNPRFSNNRHNRYLKFYIGLYKTLIQYKAVSGNVPKGIDKLIQTVRIRKTLSDKERKRFLNIFSHITGPSGSLFRFFSIGVAENRS